MTPEPTTRSVFVDTGDGRCPIGLHLEMLADDLEELETEIRVALAGRPQGTTTFVTTMADGLEQAARRLLTAWREHYPAPTKTVFPVDPSAPLVAGRPSLGKVGGYRVADGRVTLADGRSFPVSDITIERADAAPMTMAPISEWSFEIEGALTPRGVQVFEQIAAAAAEPEQAPLPDAEGLAAAERLACPIHRPAWVAEAEAAAVARGAVLPWIGPDRRTPAEVAAADAAAMDRIMALPDAVDPSPGDRTAQVMANLETSIAAGKAAAARHLRKGTKVRVVDGHPIIGGLPGTVVTAGPSSAGLVEVEFALNTYGSMSILSIDRDVLEVPLQAGDWVVHETEGLGWRVQQVLPDGRLILDDADSTDGRSGPWLPDGWERVK